ncbi:ABC transporter ATP-binding protein [Aquamicrobium sp. LC103]|uniref:ATP-binding cassette domain-containing protein n=1 Tax=Aquamicrobium sp. LC103 TaxID=1120658 RepID=UPI00063ECB3A|nr:ABC transporter ATP-binding protein [Aquamicrobium sp. LC103]TKT76353.1 ABC transporter ATP-binding protein [Aquamicrobium sp. LC103]
MTALLSINSLHLRLADGKELVSNVSFSVAPGERVGLIGESGSGKSLTAMAAVGLLPDNITASGSVLLDGQEVVGAPERSLNRLRGSAAAVVFQEPLTALDPLMRVGAQIASPLRRRLLREGGNPGKAGLRREVAAALAEVALPEPERIARAYPHEISGGQRQRVAIAMALSCRPKLLIADEPTTALDVTTQAEILKLLDQLVRERGMGLLFISHDLPVVATIAERAIVLRAGRPVEEGPVGKVLSNPQDQYTKQLVSAARTFDEALEGRS